MLELSHIWFRSTDDLSLQSRVYSPERQAPSSVALANTPQQKELHLTSTSKKATVARRAATQQYEQASVDQDHLTSILSKSHLLCLESCRLHRSTSSFTFSSWVMRAKLATATPVEPCQSLHRQTRQTLITCSQATLVMRLKGCMN